MTKSILKANCIFLFLGLLVNASCKKEEMEVNVKSNNKTIDVGAFELLPSSIAKLPYLNKKEAVFVDILNNAVVFKITNRPLLALTKAKLYHYNVHMPMDTITYIYNGENKSIGLDNDSLNMHFSINLETKLDYDNPQNKQIADVLDIYLFDSVVKNKGVQVFNNVVNLRTWSQGTTNLYYPEYNVFNKKFTKAFSTYYSNHASLLYFNFEFGIVSFTDHEGKTWAFEKMI